MASAKLPNKLSKTAKFLIAADKNLKYIVPLSPA